MAEEKEAFVKILEKLETRLAKVDQVQGSRVKLPKAEIELLEQIGVIRDALDAMHGTKSKLPLELSEIARVRVVLESLRLSANNSNDARVASCMRMVESCETLAKEGGIGNRTLAEMEAELQELQEQERRALSESVRLQDVHAVVSVRMKLQKLINLQRSRRDMVPSIVSETDLTKLLAMEPNSNEALDAWMVWMIHRVYLDDPSLEYLDFTNLQMPTPIRMCGGDAIMDERATLLAPKLVQSLATNTNVQVLNLANTNLQGVEARQLGEALKKNATLRRINIDSNMLTPSDLEIVILGLKENTSVEEFRCNNQLLGDIGRSNCAALEALLDAVQTNTRLVKVGLHIQDSHFNNEINAQLIKNNAEAKAHNKLMSALAANLTANDAALVAGFEGPITPTISRRNTKESLDDEERSDIARSGDRMGVDFTKDSTDFCTNTDTRDDDDDAADSSDAEAKLEIVPSKSFEINVGVRVTIKMNGQQGEIAMTNGHAHKVCGFWYPTEDLEIIGWPSLGA